MKVNVDKWPLPSVFGMKDNINTNPDYQRPAVWTTAQKQLLIDTILRGYDIPKLYLRDIGNEQFEVIDGQQRLRTIWAFMSNEFKLSDYFGSLLGHDLSSLKYESFPPKVRVKFDRYNLDIVEISAAEEHEVRELFLRLQNGTPLKAQEKRNAMPGDMRDFVKSLVGHKFFTDSIVFKNSRYSHDHIAAQLCLLELSGNLCQEDSALCNIKDRDLTNMYKAHSTFDSGTINKLEHTKKVLNYMNKVFPSKTPELARFNVISLYIIFSILLSKYVTKGKNLDISNWFINFEKFRKSELRKKDQCDPEVAIYNSNISHSTDSSDSLKSRNRYLIGKLFECVPNFALKDPNREFSFEQKLAIFRRDKGECQVKRLCTGTKCDWGDFHADHKIPWSSGGLTIVENGQIACPACNLSKGAK